MLVYFAYSAIKKAEVEEPAEGVILFRNPRHGYLFIIPAMCDMVATSLMYVGLTMTSASSFQVAKLAVHAGVNTFCISDIPRITDHLHRSAHCCVAQEKAGMVQMAGNVRDFVWPCYYWCRRPLYTSGMPFNKYHRLPLSKSQLHRILSH